MNEFKNKCILFLLSILNKKGLIVLNNEQGEEVMESLEWAVEEEEKMDDVDKYMYRHYISTYHSIARQLNHE